MFTSPCATCPWLKSNFGKPHSAKWYTLKNLTRLWNGLRTGRAPGMICHATDPNSPDYGGSKKPKPGQERECVGAIILLKRHADSLANCDSFKEYQSKHEKPMTRHGMAMWVERVIFGHIAMPNMTNDVGLPWEKEIKIEDLMKGQDATVNR